MLREYTLPVQDGAVRSRRGLLHRGLSLRRLPMPQFRCEEKRAFFTRSTDGNVELKMKTHGCLPMVELRQQAGVVRATNQMVLRVKLFLKTSFVLRWGLDSPSSLTRISQPASHRDRRDAHESWACEPTSRGGGPTGPLSRISRAELENAGRSAFVADDW